jgi:hypothetical protein
MSAVASDLGFEVRRFSATPVSADVALLELEGRFHATMRRRLGAPRLLVEDADEHREVPYVDGAHAVADPEGGEWWASFTIPVRMLGGGVFALAVGRELLLDLPAPDRAEDNGRAAAADLHVRLAREANALRRRADEAREAAATALAGADVERAARERMEAELRGERHAREELATRLGQFEQALEQARRDHAAELRERDEAMERLRTEHAEELKAAADRARAEGDERVGALEAEAAELRRALKGVRADVELMRRERDRARAQAEALRPDPPTAPQLPVVAGDPRDDERDDDGDPPTTTARTTPLIDDLAGEPAGWDDDETGDDDGDGWDRDDGFGEDRGEGVRVLGGRRPRARGGDAGDRPPADPPPGTAQVGARHITPGRLGRSRAAAWLSRLAAIFALAVVIAAVLLVIWGLR